jgi:hypothetical protein
MFKHTSRQCFKFFSVLADSIKNSCAANFSFAQLAKRKSLGRSKPATNSQAQAPQHPVWSISTISKSYRTAFYRNKMSTTRCEWVRPFISRQSSLHIVAWDLDVERSQLCKVLVAKTRMMSNPVTQQKDLLTIIYALTTVKGASVKISFYIHY